MNDLNQLLIMKIFYENKNCEIISEKEITIEEIIKKCQEEFKLKEKEINNMNIYFIDEERDKNLITNMNDLITFAKEIDSSTFLINLNIEINSKINNNYKNIDIIEEKKEILIDNNNQNNNNIIENKIKEDSNIIILKLKKEIEFLKKTINNYRKRIKNIIIFYDNALNGKNKYIDKDELNVEEEKIDDINNNILLDEIENKILKDDNKDNKNENIINQNNNISFEIIEKGNEKIEDIKTIFKLDKNININILEIIYNKCNNCNKHTKNRIYKCIYCDNYSLCNKCYDKNNNNKNKLHHKLHKHEDFCEIKYSEKYYMTIKGYTKIKTSELQKSFNEILNKVFLDKKGNINKNPLDTSDTKNLKHICQEMILIKIDPLELYGNYQLKYINKEIKNFDEQTKIVINNKLLLFLDKLKLAIQK